MKRTIHDRFDALTDRTLDQPATPLRVMGCIAFCGLSTIATLAAALALGDALLSALGMR